MTFIYGGAEFARDGLEHAEGEAPNDSVHGAQKDAEALLLHRGIETAVDGDTDVAQM